MPKVALIMGSKSDWPSLKGCVDVLKKFEIEVEVHVASAHRTPKPLRRSRPTRVKTALRSSLLRQARRLIWPA